jgi:hypothetical protein
LSFLLARAPTRKLPSQLSTAGTLLGVVQVSQKPLFKCFLFVRTHIHLIVAKCSHADETRHVISPGIPLEPDLTIGVIEAS